MSGARVEMTLTDEERSVLERWSRRPKSSQASALRCRIVLAPPTARAARTSPPSSGAVRRQWASGGAGSPARGWTGCTTSPGPGSRARSPTTTSSGWSSNAGGAAGRCHALVDAVHGGGDRPEPDGGQPIWRAFGLKPHQTEAFKLSPDPQFIDKVRDVVGLYLNPPDAAVALCVDEKVRHEAP